MNLQYAPTIFLVAGMVFFFVLLLSLTLCWLKGAIPRVSQPVVIYFVRPALLVLTLCAVLHAGFKPRQNGQTARNKYRHVRETNEEFKISRINKLPDFVLIDIAWSSGLTLPNNAIDILTCTNLTERKWSLSLTMSLSPSTTNATIQICDIPPTNSPSCFFVLACTQLDSDADGISDAIERNVVLSSPTDHDTDHDLLNDAFELFVTGSPPTVHDEIGDWLPPQPSPQSSGNSGNTLWIP